MRVLLDTYVLLWTLSDDPKLSGKARKLIESAADIYISAATFWEMAIKVGLGNLTLIWMKSANTVSKAGSSSYR